MASIQIAQGFIGIVKVIELNIFCFYFFSSLLGKLQASTSSEPCRISYLIDLCRCSGVFFGILLARCRKAIVELSPAARGASPKLHIEVYNDHRIATTRALVVGRYMLSGTSNFT